MSVGYEWVTEEVEDTDLENEVDVISMIHYDTFRKAAERAEDLRAQGKQAMVGLVRDVGNEIDGLTDRQWAYIEDGQLPEKFDGGARVPKRFMVEVCNANSAGIDSATSAAGMVVLTAKVTR
jgi:hypothetical protein